MTLIIGSAGSGKTMYMKKKILEDIDNGIPIIYINFRRSSDEFSNKITEDSLIINANSFTQI